MPFTHKKEMFNKAKTIENTNLLNFRLKKYTLF
jgi:hypothetical protein